MKLTIAMPLLGLGISLAACNTMSPAAVADVACIGAQTASSIAVVATTDANPQANAAPSVTRDQAVASTVQKTVSDICPVLTNGVQSITAAVGR